MSSGGQIRMSLDRWLDRDRVRRGEARPARYDPARAAARRSGASRPLSMITLLAGITIARVSDTEADLPEGIEALKRMVLEQGAAGFQNGGDRIAQSSHREAPAHAVRPLLGAACARVLRAARAAGRGTRALRRGDPEAARRRHPPCRCSTQGGARPRPGGYGPMPATTARPGATIRGRCCSRYSPDRRGERPREHLKQFTGILQADAYSGFRGRAGEGSGLLVARPAQLLRKRPPNPGLTTVGWVRRRAEARV